MSDKHIQRCSTLLIIREMQIKTTVRYHFTSTVWLLSKKQNKTKQKTMNVGEDVVKLEPCAPLVGM